MLLLLRREPRVETFLFPLFIIIVNPSSQKCNREKNLQVTNIILSINTDGRISDLNEVLQFLIWFRSVEICLGTMDNSQKQFTISKMFNWFCFLWFVCSSNIVGIFWISNHYLFCIFIAYKHLIHNLKS